MWLVLLFQAWEINPCIKVFRHQENSKIKDRNTKNIYMHRQIFYVQWWWSFPPPPKQKGRFFYILQSREREEEVPPHPLSGTYFRKLVGQFEILLRMLELHQKRQRIVQSHYYWLMPSHVTFRSHGKRPSRNGRWLVAIYILRYIISSVSIPLWLYNLCCI